MPSIPMSAKALVETLNRTIEELYDRSDTDDNAVDDLENGIIDLLLKQSLEFIGGISGGVDGAMGWEFKTNYFLGKTEGPNPFDKRWHLFCLSQWDDERSQFIHMGELSADDLPLEQAAYQLLTEYVQPGDDENSIVELEILLEEWRCKITGEPYRAKFLWDVDDQEWAQLLERGKDRMQGKVLPFASTKPNEPEIPKIDASMLAPSAADMFGQIEANMVAVKGGEFTMGCTSEQGGDCFDNEKPAHIVTVNSFQMGKYQVTQAQWRAVMGSNPSKFNGCDDCPVENVSWHDIQDFIRKLNQQTGKNYRLPTEAEWEFAARGGNKSKGYRYAGSDDLWSVAWHGKPRDKTHAVGQKQMNELGIYDMSGNVLEWCEDWHGVYSSSPQTNPKGPQTGLYRVLRGGSWIADAESCRVSARNIDNPYDRLNLYGFRLVLP